MATTTYGTPYVSGTDLVANWPAASLTVANSIDEAGYYVGRGINAQTASYTGVLTDAGKTVTMTNAGATTFTVPANASVAYPTGTRINILNLGAGACTPTAGAGVTINGTITALATNGSASLIKTATNTWSYIPSGGGGILQVKSTTKSSTFSTASTSLVDLTGLSVAITPTSASNLVLVTIHLNWGIDYTTGAMQAVLLRGATTIGIGDAAGSRSRSTWNRAASAQNQSTAGTLSMTFLDSPATTSATTYKVQVLVNAGTAYINQTVTDTDSSIYTRSISTITAMEVTP